jgi:DNA-3-methyladenine glycosylase I
MKKRCAWPGENKLLIDYHDSEWGYPRHSDAQHFEFLILEAAQAGLSWLTVLKRREGYRRAFAGFDARKVARFNKRKIEGLLKDPGIIRNRLKVESAVHNARLFLAVQKEFGSFDKYFWGFACGEPIVNKWRHTKQIPATSPISDALSKDLKKRGFKFVGSTVIYAHMQAVGMVNDHLVGCFRHKQVQRREYTGATAARSNCQGG